VSGDGFEGDAVAQGGELRDVVAGWLELAGVAVDPAGLQAALQVLRAE
jgi:hypothetical protein